MKGKNIMQNKTPEWITSEELDNLVPYTHPSAAWSDRNSTVAVSWHDESCPGLQALHIVYGWGGSQLTQQTLAWEVLENGAPLDLALKSRVFRPEKVYEADTGPEYTLESTAFYPHRNVIAVEFRLTNHSSRQRNLAVRFGYPGKGVAPDWEDMFPENHFVSVDNQSEGSWSTLFEHREHGRKRRWVKSYAVGLTDKATVELTCLADLRERAFTIPGGGSADFTVIMSFGLTQGRAMNNLRQLPKEISPDDETKRIMELLAGAAPLPAHIAANPDYRKMYAHAITGMNSLFIRGDGGYTGDKRIPYTTKSILSGAFFWDTAFTCMGALEFDVEACKESIECFTDNISPRGSMPGTLFDSHRSGEGQAPVMSLAAWQVFKKCGDKDWLGRIYPGLAAYYKYWKRYHSSTRGFCMFYNAGQIGDNDVRFDAVYGRQQGNEAIYGFESPDLSAFFVVELRCLSHMARALGRWEEADDLARQADELAAKIVDAFYFPEHAMFFDVREGTREIFSGTKGPNMFLPLWAGVPLPTDEVKKVVERHMLNPDEFYRDLPFPSVSYDNPSYDPNGYWRGRMWPHIVYLMIQTLWRQGYHAEAELTAKRLLALLGKHPWLHENFNSEDGSALYTLDWGGIHGYPEYNWTQSVAIMLLLEQYKQPFDA